jgi:hypothetical protein
MAINLLHDPMKELWEMLFKILRDFIRITPINHNDGFILKAGKVLFRILGVPLFL